MEDVGVDGGATEGSDSEMDMSESCLDSLALDFRAGYLEVAEYSESSSEA